VGGQDAERSASQPPIFVFAYANDRASEARYLRDLPEERRRVRDALRAAEEAQRCKLVVCPNATIGEVIRECQLAGQRLAVFHFGGHADGRALSLEQRDGSPARADAGALAELLGGIGSLKLVVLNGCSTRDHVELLLARGIPAVIATSTAIRDDVATEFAAAFYTALASHSSINQAFQQASGAGRAIAQPEAPDAPVTARSVTRNIEPPSRPPDPTAWPWEKYGGDRLEAVLLPAIPRLPPPVPVIPAPVNPPPLPGDGAPAPAPSSSRIAIVAGILLVAGIGAAALWKWSSFSDGDDGAARADARLVERAAPVDTMPVAPAPVAPASVDAAAVAAAPVDAVAIHPPTPTTQPPPPAPPSYLHTTEAKIAAKIPGCRAHVRAASEDATTKTATVYARCTCGSTDTGELAIGTETSGVLTLSSLDVAIEELAAQCSRH
jgi:hypothetical protein